MKTSLRLTAFLGIALSLVLTSCAVTENLSVDKRNGGDSSVNLKVENFFQDVLADFNEFSTTKDSSTVLDNAVKELETSLQKGKGTKDVKFTKKDADAYEGTFTFTSLSSLFADLGADKDQTILVQSGNTLTFRLDMENYEQLTKIIAFLKDKNFEPFGPTYNQGISESDYLDMISFMLGEEGPDAIKNSQITLNLKTPGTITSFTGGKKLDDTSFQFSFPLIDFLLLQNPLSFSVSWK